MCSLPADVRVTVTLTLVHRRRSNNGNIVRRRGVERLTHVEVQQWWFQDMVK